MTIAINGTGTITGITAGGLPDAIITQPDLATGVAGTGPAFSAYLATTQSVTGGVWTKVTLNTEEFDTNNNFDPVTNYRFTPTIAGYYQISASVYCDGTSGSGAGYVMLYKNGVANKRAGVIASYGAEPISALIYCNGTTDYIELYALVASSMTSPYFAGGNAPNYTFMTGVLVRAA